VKGLYIDTELWEAVEDAPRKVQGEYLAALARLYFMGEEADGLKGIAKAAYKPAAGRVRSQRAHAIAGKKGGDAKARNVANDLANGVANDLADGLANGVANGLALYKDGDRDRDRDRGRSKHVAAFQRPTIAEISDYIDQKGYGFSAEEFYDHYEANGWMVGKVKMKSWKHALANWERQRSRFSKPNRDSQFDYDDEGWMPEVASW
jgi:hypothetical protein